MPSEIPVYVFAGFLESGKTKFIQETLADPEFNDGGNILVLVCEDGVEEYEPKAYSGENVFFKFIEKPEDLNKIELHRALRENGCNMVLVEYNGMWLLDDLFNAMPKTWVLAQLAVFADAGTFETYNANMRNLCYDKLRGCSLVVFNRCKNGFDKLPLHKLVRAANRVTNIIYEYEDGSMEYDEIEDPLPYDISAPVVVIEDRDYAWFYQDIMTDGEKYYGKTLQFTGFVKNNLKLPDKTFLFGRRMMTCCADDIAFSGFMVVSKNADKVKNGQWLTLKVKVDEKVFDAIGDDLKILRAQGIEKAQKPEPEVATFA